VNIHLQPGAVYVLPITADALGTILTSLAKRPYEEVAPLMLQISAEIARQNQEALTRAAPVHVPPASADVMDPVPPLPEAMN